jgi:hypothetical protein
MSQPQIGQSRNPSATIVLSGQGDVTLIIMQIQQTPSDSLISGRLAIPDAQSTLPTRRLSEQKTAEGRETYTHPKQPTQLTRSNQHRRQPQRTP